LFAGLLLAGTALAGVTLAGASDRQNAAITQYGGVAPFEDDRGGGVGPDRRHGGNGNGNGGYGHGSDPGSFKPAHDGGGSGNGGGGSGSGSSEAEGTLAFTGFNLVILLVIGLVLVLLGSVLLMRDRAAGRAAQAG
jgi:hypothetical protein